jgi:hypothetical protein
VKGFSHVFVSVVVPAVFLVGSLGLIVGCGEVFFEELNDVHVGVGDVAVVLFDLLVFLLVLHCTLLNFGVLADFNQGDLTLALSLHLGAEVLHLLFVLQLDLIADSLVVAADCAHFLVVGLVKGVNIFLLTALLLFFLNFKRS